MVAATDKISLSVRVAFIKENAGKERRKAENTNEAVLKLGHWFTVILCVCLNVQGWLLNLRER